MCGIVGFLAPQKNLRHDEMQCMIQAMNQTILHRGPDDGGEWVGVAQGVALANRRLAIVDLSPAGHQPMHSPAGRYTIVFNGEIYNFKQLRAELEQSHTIAWRGHSDTEVLLQAITYWGIERTLQNLVGMFAFALWDQQTQTLTLARDRIGEKPLYYGWIDGIFLFGSELKALRAHPVWRDELNRDALAVYLRHNYIPAPYSIYQSIAKLPPGTYLRVDCGNVSSTERQAAIPCAYWSVKQVAETGINNRFTGSDQEAIQELDRLLRQSVAGQMLADVPLGAFLSGGIDSSTIVAIMQALSRQPVKTFTIGFYEKEFNEAEHAKQVAKHLGTEHIELYLTADETRNIIPRLPTLYDEPFADSSQIPTFLVSQLARQHVTVSLSGDAGDELFAGYNTYARGNTIWQRSRQIPDWLRAPLGQLCKHYDLKWLAPFLPIAIQQRFSPHRIQKMGEMLRSNSPALLYHQLLTHWAYPDQIVLNAKESPTALTDPNQVARFAKTSNHSDITEQMMYLDLIQYLPDDILVKVDRAAMGVSLETRVPLLDHRIIEFAWRLPLRMKIRQGQRKWLLRQVLAQYVPPELFERPKKGFSVPIGSWLRGPLRDWAEALLDLQLLQTQGIFDPAPIHRLWRKHTTGIGNWSTQLWSVLMFQAWLEATK